jgi:hypothetical protein
MTRNRVLTSIGGLAVAAAIITIGVSQAAATGSTDTISGAVIGHVTAAPAHFVNLSSVPTGFAPSGPSLPAILRRAAPLPSAPSTGSKVSGGTASPTPFVQTTNSFDGINLATADCGCQPPDVNATIGPNNILEIVNLEFAVYDKSGNLQFRTSLNNFLGTGDALSDPRAVYDPTWNRWSFSVLDENNASLWLVYSASSDPLGGWWFYDISWLPAGSITDYPQVGMDQNAFIYTTNNFDASSNYINSTAFLVPKSRVYNGFGWGAGLAGVNYNTTPAIVAGHPTQQTNFLYMLSPDDANNVMYVYQWGNTGGASPTLVYKGAIAYNWAAPPRRVNQPGTSVTLDPLDGRIDWSATQLDGRVWFAHGVAVGSFPGVNYGFVNPTNMTISTNTAFQGATSDDFNPSISVQNSSGGIPQEFLTWAYTDTPNNVPTRDVYALNQGTTLSHLVGTQYGPNGNSTSETRFGDYSSSWPEYNAVGNCAEGVNALVANQYFRSDGTWQTRLARVHRSGC